MQVSGRNENIWQRRKKLREKGGPDRTYLSVAVMDRAIKEMSSLRTPTPFRKEKGRNTALEIWKRVQVDRKDSLRQ